MTVTEKSLMIVYVFIQFVQECVPRSELFNKSLEVTKKAYTPKKIPAHASCDE